jgi:hypothetical protein
MSDDISDIDEKDVLEVQRQIEERRYKKYTVEDCLRAIQEVDQRTELRLSESRYMELKDQHHPHRNTIRNRLGTWTDARERALDGS